MMANSYMYTQETRYSSPEEIIDATVRVDFKRDNKSAGIPIISDGKTAYVDASDTNSIIISAPGGGKTRRVAIPLVISCASSDVSMIINDPKAEIIRNTYDYLEKKGYVIRVLNMRNASLGDGYNPLLYGATLFKKGKVDAAKEEFYQLAETLYSDVHSEKDPFWEIMSCNLFVSYCLIACRQAHRASDVTIPFVYHLFTEGEEKIGGNTIIKEYLKFIDDQTISDSIVGYVNAATETKGSILAVFSSVLSKLVTNASISEMITYNTIDPLELVKKKTALFIVPRDEVGVYNTLVTVIIDQLYSRLILEADKTNGVLSRRCEFIIDEFSNLVPLHNIDNKVSECRSRNIRMHLFIQSYDQLTSRYNELAPVILSCCQNTFFMHSPESRILETISSRCGSYVSEYTHERRRLLSVSDLQHFDKDKGEMLVLLNRCYPYVTMLPDVSEYARNLEIKYVQDPFMSRSVRKTKFPFSMKDYVQKRRDEEIEKMLKDHIPGDRVEIKEKHINVEDIIDRINNELQTLEEQEEKNVSEFKKKVKDLCKADKVKELKELLDETAPNRDRAVDLLECLQEDVECEEILRVLLKEYRSVLATKEFEVAFDVAKQNYEVAEWDIDDE